LDKKAAETGNNLFGHI